jgi:tetratricopeptide (TPR) repeat protein
MFTNETSKCSIAAKSSGVIEFTMKLKRIEFGGYYCEQSAVNMFELAKSYKEKGVKMFKEYPLFAHNYFNLAAKCLLSFNPFDDLEDLLADSSLSKTDFVELLQNVYLNIAACLVKQQRFEDVLHVLSYSKTQDNPSEKAIYRLALAYFHLKQFDNAKATIERISYKNNKDLVQLMAKILENRKVDNENYSCMVKKMFA